MQVIENAGTIGVNRRLFLAERIGRFATFGKANQVARPGPQLVKRHQLFATFG
jgi:hypothetical protein